MNRKELCRSYCADVDQFLANALSKRSYRRTVYGFVFLCALQFLAFQFLSFAVLPGIGPFEAIAEPLYQWTDKDGKLHFSTSPEHPAAKATTLPEVKRENIDRRIKNIKEQTPANCLQHGGADCSLGADTDGSVICLDGYRNAIAPFRFECLEARLDARFEVVLAGKELAIVHSRKLRKQTAGETIEALRVAIRNHSNITAKNVVVEFFLGGKKAIPAIGPTDIDAFGNADYTVSLMNMTEAPSITDIERTRYEVRCTNCAGFGN